MTEKKVLIFIVAYNAEKTIASVLNRIPDEVFTSHRYQTEILIIDDSSADKTFQQSHTFKSHFDKCPLNILKNPVNLGYGGNQKLGYHYALEHGFDIVALIHGDGQYAPEELPRLLEPLLQDECDAVFGSRMQNVRSAIAGGMPMYKVVGNQILTFLENLIVGTHLSEYHSGYRLYSCKALRAIPFERNSNYFDFDTDIIIQLHATGHTIRELPIPTFYGDEICYVNGLQYAIKILFSCLLYRIQRMSLFYEAKFDVETENNQYRPKFGFASSHQYAANQINPQDRVLLLGCGPTELVSPFAERARSVSAADMYISSSLRTLCRHAWEVDFDSISLGELAAMRDEQFDKVLALDIIEHLRSPERFLSELRHTAATRNAEVVLTTPNIAFFSTRLMLLVGMFNYGKRGILDRTHTRLFTFRSLRKLCHETGFRVLECRGVPAPFPLAVGDNSLGRFMVKVNEFLIRLLPGLFSYQIFATCKAIPTVESLLSAAVEYSRRERERSVVEAR